MKDKYVFYFSGGVMSGAFGAGVGAGLVEAGFENYYEIETMYGSSAGICTVVYYASRQPLPVGPSIYWEDLATGFILGQNLPLGILQRFCLRCFGRYPGNLVNAVNIDLPMTIFSSGENALDVNRIKICPFPLFVKIWDVKGRCWQFVDLRTCDEPLGLIKASISVIPYYFSPEDTDSIQGIDLCLADPLTLDLIASRHPKSKTVFIINNTQRATLSLKIVRFLEGIAANWCYREIDATCLLNGISKLEEDIETIKSAPNMLLVSPPDEMLIKPFTTDFEKLIRAYETGKQESQKILDFAKN